MFFDLKFSAGAPAQENKLQSFTLDMPALAG
jgi:hypothetical protein